MKIDILKPIGWCSGVTNAVNHLQKIVSKHKKQKIYLIGWLVHNQLLMQTLQKKGILVLDDRQKTRLELLTKIKDPNAVIVFSAHGTPQEALDYANTHFKQFYDLTCPYLQDHFILIKRLIKQGYRIIYYGKKQHPETHAVLSFSSHIYLIENVNDVNKIQWDATKKFALVNQSTIPDFFVKKIQDASLSFNSTLYYANTTCRAMRIRYENLIKLKGADLLIVIGDKYSNNVDQLVNLANSHQIKTQLITNVDDVKVNIFKNIKHLAITSGTSVDLKYVQTIVKKIKTTV